MIRSVFVLFICLVCSSMSLGHDFWIEPRSFRLDKPAKLPIYLVVGEHFRGDRVIPPAKRVSSFQIVTDEGRADLMMPRQASIAGIAKADREGLSMVVYRGNPKLIRLDADKFNGYLESEGLTQIIQAREDSGQIDKAARELYSRCAKALVTVGEAPGEGWDKSVGHTLEFIPRTNPFTGDSGALTVQLLYEGKPLADAHVVAMHREDPSINHASRTNATGEVTFPIARNGIWMVKTVHMVHHPGETAEWESVWASLTFQRGS